MPEGDDLLDGFWPYRGESVNHRRIPDRAVDRADVLQQVAAMARREDAVGDEGRVSGSLYSGDHDHYRYLSQIFGLFAHANVLQRDMYPSATKFEGEIIAMTLDLVHAEAAGGAACGVITSGGSESLITAMFAYREQAAELRGVARPNIVMPTTAHVAMDKGGHWLGVEVRHAPLRADYAADVDAMADLIDDQTVALFASAGNYPHGLIDPIAELSDLALQRGIGLHVDGCLGGFLLPWFAELGHEIPQWDFRLPGVTSISADTHKFAYALKGTSTLLYRDRELRRRQYFAYPDWPGGLYHSPGLAGSRSGGLLAATWAALITTGREQYLESARRIWAAARLIRDGVAAIDGLQVIGDPTFLIAFRSTRDDLDIYLVNDRLQDSGWRLNSLQLPPALHFCVTRPNTRPGVAEAFVAALAEAVDWALANAGTPARSGAVYGLGAMPQGHDVMNQILSGALDAMLEVAPEPSGG
jgi:glutamate/tyrosine decarboxylase-like PLP-dependent enzyme